MTNFHRDEAKKIFFVLRPPAFKSPTKSKGGGTADRGDLLKSIQQGKALKKAVTNDRSAPLVGGKSANNNNNAVNANNNRTGGSASTQGNLLKDIYNQTVRRISICLPNVWLISFS